MKTQKKSKGHIRRPVVSEPVKIHGTRQIYRRQKPEEKRTETYTPMETGQPEPEFIPDFDNPLGVQGGRGPLNQEGEGERQNDQLAELEQVEADLWEAP